MDEPTTGDPLQFDKAEFESGHEGLACTYCQRPILDAYYEVSGQTSCEDCRGDVEARRTQGSPAGRVFKAIALGSLGGLIGAGVYYGIAALTGYEFGLIAIGVGILVGIGVRMGSGGAGGRGYQWLAAAITYVAIVSTYIPLIIESLEQAGEETAQSEDGAPLDRKNNGSRLNRLRMRLPRLGRKPQPSPQPCWCSSSSCSHSLRWLHRFLLFSRVPQPLWVSSSSASASIKPGASTPTSHSRSGDLSSWAKEIPRVRS